MYQQLRRDLDTGWDAALVQAQKYYSANGTLEMPRKMIVEDNLDLSAWVAAQRQVRVGRRPGYLTQRQIEQLDELKLPWQGLSGQTWERGCQAAQPCKIWRLAGAGALSVGGRPVPGRVDRIQPPAPADRDDV